MLDLKLSIKSETTISVNGRNVKFIEFNTIQDGDFVKICTDDHSLRVKAEYAWFKNKYNNTECIEQKIAKINLNGEIVEYDIVTLKLENGKLKKIYFDISQMIENEKNSIRGERDKEK